MIITLLNWIYIFVTTFIVGYFALPRIAALIDKDASISPNWCDSVIAGLIIVTVYAQIFSLFGGVGLIANIILILCCAVFGFIDRKRLSGDFRRASYKPTFLIVVAAVVFAINLMFTALSSFHYDTGLYHAQAIHWIEEYGVIKGLGLVHVRLAYNSAFFPLSAMYSMHWLGTSHQSLHGVNGFISVIICLYSVYGWRRAFIGRNSDNNGASSVCNLVRLAPLFYLLICLLELTSPESDFITVYLIIWIMLRLFELYAEKPGDDNLTGLCLLSVASFALVGYKLSAAVVASITIWPLVVLIRKKRIKSIVVCAVLAALTILPYIIRNVIICGWPVYPVAAFDMFNLPWKFDKDVLVRDAAEIGEWAKSLGSVIADHESVSGWFVFWWDGQFLATRMFVSSLLMCLPVMLISFFDRKCAFIKYLMVIMTASIVFYIFKAPVIRYCYGPVLVLPLAVIGHMLDRLRENHTIVVRILGIAVAGVVIFPSLYSTKELIKYDYEESVGRFSFAEQIVSQVDYPESDVKARDWYGNTVYLPNEGDQCWYYAFPSSPYHECFDYNRPVSDDLSDGIVPAP